jgi:hypothetical protein
VIDQSIDVRAEAIACCAARFARRRQSVIDAPPIPSSTRNRGHLTKGGIKYAWAFPRIIRLEKTLQNSITARFTAGLALQTGCLVVPDLTPLLTKIRTFIHEEISLPWRTLFPLSSNDPNELLYEALRDQAKTGNIA